MQTLVDIVHNYKRGAVVYSDGLVITIRKSGQWTMYDSPGCNSAVGVVLFGVRNGFRLCQGEEKHFPSISREHATALASLLRDMR